MRSDIKKHNSIQSLNGMTPSPEFTGSLENAVRRGCGKYFSLFFCSLIFPLLHFCTRNGPLCLRGTFEGASDELNDT